MVMHFTVSCVPLTKTLNDVAILHKHQNTVTFCQLNTSEWVTIQLLFCTYDKKTSKKNIGRRQYISFAHKNARICGSRIEYLLQKLSIILYEGKNTTLTQHSELAWLKKTKTCILIVEHVFLPNSRKRCRDKCKSDDPVKMNLANEMGKQQLIFRDKFTFLTGSCLTQKGVKINNRR